MTLVPRVGPARARTGATTAFAAPSRRRAEPRSSWGGTTTHQHRRESGGKDNMKPRQVMAERAKRGAK